MKCIISVLGKDRTGVVAAISTVLEKCGANIEDISQTILKEIFSMTMVVTLNLDVMSFNEVQESLVKAGEDVGMQVLLQRQDLFESMHKI